MRRTLRILDTGIADGRWNVAATAALAGSREASGAEAPDILRLHRYEPCVLIGSGQAAGAAVDLAACRRSGIALARRVTGGGAVFMAPSVQALDLVAWRGGAALPEMMALAAAAIARAVRRLGAAAVADENAVTIAGRKVCGLSGGFSGPVLCLQASLLVDLDEALMAAVLVPRRDAHFPAPEVTTLRREIGEAPTDTAVVAALAAEMAPVWAASVPDAMRPEETALAERLLAAEFGRDDVVLGQPAPAGVH